MVMGRQGVKNAPQRSTGDVAGNWEVLKYLGKRKEGKTTFTRHWYLVKCRNCGHEQERSQDKINRTFRYCKKCRYKKKGESRTGSTMTDKQAREIARGCGW